CAVRLDSADDLRLLCRPAPPVGELARVLVRLANRHGHWFHRRLPGQRLADARRRQGSNVNTTRRMVGGKVSTQNLDQLGPRTAEAVETMSPVPRRWRRGVLVALLVVTAGLSAAQLALGQAGLPIAWLAAAPLVASVTLSIKATTTVAGEALALAALVQFATPGRVAIEWARLVVLCLLCVFAIVNAVLRALAAARLERVRAVARVAQAAILH